MVYRPKIDDKLCFVLMPFGPPFDSYYHRIIKPAAAEANLATLRSDEIHSTKTIVDDIWQNLWAARVVVADVSHRNPNVNYELGLCDALGIPTIIITGKIEDVPFDYKHKRCIIYNRAEAGCDEKLRDDLVSTIRVVLQESATEDQLKWPYDTRALRESGPTGVLLASADSRGVVIRGATLVRAAIATALGPRGTAVSLSHNLAGTVRLNRGAQIASGIKSSNPLEEKGIEQIRAASSAVYEAAGDCSKLVSILTAGFLTKGQELIDKGFHPRDVVDSFGRSIEKVLGHLGRETQPISDDKLKAVATTAAGGDRMLATLVVEAIRRVGNNGVITIETSDQSQTTLEIIEGAVLEQGYLSEYFVTNAETSDCVLEDCAILLAESPIQSMKQLLPLLEEVAKADTSLLIVAGNVEGEALSTLTVNKIRGILRCAAVKAPGHGDRRKGLMEDIAVLTGGRFLSDDLGVPVANVKLRDLGKAKKVIVSRTETTIIGGTGSNKSIQERIRLVRSQIDFAPNAFEREKLQERLAKLSGALAVLKLGGPIEADLTQERYRLESAMHSARSAIRYGWVAGGGIALLRAGIALRREPTTSGLDTEARLAIASALEEPVQQLVENANKSPTEILVEILDSDSPYWGFDAKTCEVGDLLAAGVIDAVKPIELCLRVALSHAGSVLQTGKWELGVPPTQP